MAMSVWEEGWVGMLSLLLLPSLMKTPGRYTQNGYKKTLKGGEKADQPSKGTWNPRNNMVITFLV